MSKLIFACVSLQVPCLMRSKRMGLVHRMTGSMSLEGSGWGDVISFWHLKGIILASLVSVFYLLNLYNCAIIILYK